MVVFGCCVLRRQEKLNFCNFTVFVCLFSLETPSSNALFFLPFFFILFLLLLFIFLLLLFSSLSIFHLLSCPHSFAFCPFFFLNMYFFLCFLLYRFLLSCFLFFKLTSFQISSSNLPFLSIIIVRGQGSQQNVFKQPLVFKVSKVSVVLVCLFCFFSSMIL